ncbi:MAG: hypothetical protein HC808_15370 [Candidatus Competibacteraceae bacterium]|nr:hypothetical protein [Candidatus Competibacteraceae bacterium]
MFFRNWRLLVCNAVLTLSIMGCAHYTPEEQARFKDTRCQWVIWSSDMPGLEDCEYLLQQP